MPKFMHVNQAIALETMCRYVQIIKDALADNKIDTNDKYLVLTTSDSDFNIELAYGPIESRRAVLHITIELGDLQMNRVDAQAAIATRQPVKLGIPDATHLIALLALLKTGFEADLEILAPLADRGNWNASWIGAESSGYLATNVSYQ